MTRLLAFGLVLTSCSNLWISRNLAKAKQLNNLEQLSGAALFCVYGKYMLAEFDWGEPVGYEYKVKKSPFCFRQGGDFYYIMFTGFLW